MRITFKHVGEIRMGSPYNSARIEVDGKEVPAFKNRTMQDIAHVLSDKSTAILVQWGAAEGNRPTFHLVRLGPGLDSIIRTRRFEGAVKALQIDEARNTVKVTAFRYPDTVEYLIHFEDFNELMT